MLHGSGMTTRLLWGGTRTALRQVAWPGVRVGLVALLLLAGCVRRPPVSVEANPMVRLQAFQTYSWVSSEPRIYGRPVPPKTREQLDQRVRDAVSIQLARQGLRETDDGDPDIQVDYSLVFSERTTDTVAEYWRYWREGGGSGPSQAFVFGYSEGTLRLELVDALSEQMILRGVATTNANLGSEPQQLSEVIQRMFEPPR
jgi:hypothetical protein